MSGIEVDKKHAYVLVPKSFMKFVFSTAYRVTQKRFVCTSVHFNVGTCFSSTDIKTILKLTTPHMLINTWQELEYRLDFCRATTGAHIEVYGRA
jgi:hypothetical protein